jgi:hypothetical protein
LEKDRRRARPEGRDQLVPASGVLTIKYGNYDQLDYLRARLLGLPS